MYEVNKVNNFYKKRFKYIVGSLVASMFFVSSLTYAAEDDDVVIFGGHFESESSSDDISSNANNDDSTSNNDNNINAGNSPENTNDANSNNETRIHTNEFDNTFNNNANPTINENEFESNNSNGESSTRNVDETNSNNNTDADNTVNSNDSNSNNINNPDDINENTNNITPLENSNNLNDSSDNIYIKPNNSNNTSNSDSNANMKKLKARFVKLFSDDTYNYYLDRKSVRWVRVPYLNSEYMADVWIRMIEKKPNDENMSDDMYRYINEDVDDEITEARAKGILYDEVDVKVLRTKKYLLEHYYIRPKTQQIQFLCELEVFGRPQNAIKERSYDYKNWENLIPGSIEFAIYYSVLSDIGTSKASERGHMTAADMVEEYARISIR